MEKFVITGGKKLQGEITVSGAKNVALKALVAACLTNDPVVIENIPLISDFFIMAKIIKDLGGSVVIKDHVATVVIAEIKNPTIALDVAAQVRTSSMFLAPLLARTKEAKVPNPGGCRLGARPIDRTIDGLAQMGAVIRYDSTDGYFYAKTNGLVGHNYTFEKNTHTGTETMLLACVMAQGTSTLHNAAEEPEVDELITLLHSMGAKIKRQGKRTIVIEGVEKLHGTHFTVGADRNEIVTFAIAAIVTGGNVFVRGAVGKGLTEFLDALSLCGGGFEEKENGIRFFAKGQLSAIDIETGQYPGFMTDWQSPWAVLMTQAAGESVIHETVFESRFGYVNQLKKMGAHIEFFNPDVLDPAKTYNFNITKETMEKFQAIRVFGPTKLHNAVVSVSDLRAGATLVLAALIAKGESTVFGVEILDRGYEKFDERLKNLGANIERTQEA